MSRLRDEALALAGALEFGLLDVAEIITWADARLLQAERPPAMLCEVSLSRGRDPRDVAAILRRFPGTADNSTVTRLLIALLRDRLDADPGGVGRVAEVLYRLALAEAIESPRLSEVALWAWDALDLAEAGYLDESQEQIIRTMRDVLNETVGSSSTIWPCSIAEGEPDTPSS